MADVFWCGIAAIALLSAMASAHRIAAVGRRVDSQAGASAAILARIADDVMRLEVQVALLRQRDQVEHRPETPSRN